MNSTKTKTLVIVFALLVVTSIVAVGCKSKTKQGGGWVNTNSMPGNTFINHRTKSDAKRNNTTIVYLGSKSDSSDSGFGPRDVNFEFKGLK